MNKKYFSIFVIFFLAFAGNASAHQPRIIYLQTGDIQISDPELSQAFYDELKGTPRDYFIDSSKDFELYLNLLVPNPENKDGRYSADVFSAQGGSASGGDIQWKKLYSLDGTSFEWHNFYELLSPPFGRGSASRSDQGSVSPMLRFK